MTNRDFYHGHNIYDNEAIDQLVIKFGKWLKDNYSDVQDNAKLYYNREFDMEEVYNVFLNKEVE